MSPQGDDRPPKRSGGSGGKGKPDQPKKPGGSGSSGKGEKPEYTVYGKGGRSGQKRSGPARQKPGGKRERPPYRVYRSRPSLRDRIRKPSLSSIRTSTAEGGWRGRLSRMVGGRRPWLRWILIVAFLAMPIAILAHDLKVGWVRELALLEILAAVAVLVASRTIRPVRGEGDGGTWRWVLAALVGFAAAFVVILLVILLTGPSVSDIYRGMVRDSLEIRDFLVVQFVFPAGAALDWAIAAVAAAAIAGGVRLARGDAGRALWTGLARALVGVVILCSVAHIVPLGLNPSAGDPLVLPMLLVWVAAIPPLTVAEPPFKRFLRVLLPMVAIAETLQVYPVAGSQVGIASASFVAVGALCLADGLVDLRAWSEVHGAPAARNLALSTVVAAIALPAVFALNAIALPAVNNLQTYRNQPKLGLPGATLMHVASPQHGEYVDLVDLLHEKRCSTFVGWPSINSLYLWAELEAPRPTIPNGWFYAMTESQQQLAVEELRASPRPCAIVNDELAAGYLKGLPPPATPLVEYVQQNFRLAARIGPFEFEVPKRSATGG